MAGHNRWSKVKHRKAVVDKRRGKVWTKVSKALIVAAKHGGPDPDSNLALRYAMDEARYANMPRDTVERAIKKGAGGEDTANYEAMRYEGYGPGGVAVIVDALTDNRARTVGDVRLAFTDYGGNIGASGCVAYMFEYKGQIIIDATPPTDENDRKARPPSREAYARTIMETAINAGADDIEEPEPGDAEGQWTVLTSVPDFIAVKAALEAAKVRIAEASLAMVPTTLTAVRGDAAARVMELVDRLDDLDDVQKVFTNADVPDEETPGDA